MQVVVQLNPKPLPPPVALEGQAWLYWNGVKYGETHEFVTTIKNHYANILPQMRVAIKNFGNEAVCIFYDV